MWSWSPRMGSPIGESGGARFLWFFLYTAAVMRSVLTQQNEQVRPWGQDLTAADIGASVALLIAVATSNTACTPHATEEPANTDCTHVWRGVRGSKR